MLYKTQKFQITSSLFCTNFKEVQISVIIVVETSNVDINVIKNFNGNGK